jgi:hypothetical protein
MRTVVQSDDATEPYRLGEECAREVPHHGVPRGVPCLDHGFDGRDHHQHRCGPQEHLGEDAGAGRVAHVRRDLEHVDDQLDVKVGGEETHEQQHRDRVECGLVWQLERLDDRLRTGADHGGG